MNETKSPYQFDSGWYEDLYGPAASNRNTDTRSGYQKKDPEPVTDGKGNEISSEALMDKLEALEETMLGLDGIVSEIKDPEEQARKAITLSERWRKRGKELEKQIKQAIDYEEHCAEQLGIRRYGMADDEGDKKVTDIVDAESDWFHAEVDKLKDKLAARMRERLDEINAEGHETPAPVRDKIYDSLVDNEVVESWEPLEF